MLMTDATGFPAEPHLLRGRSAGHLLPDLAERSFAWRGTRLRYYARDDAAGATVDGLPPLLLVHGFGGGAWNFSELAPLLPGRALLIPDLPGHGGSPPLPDASSLAGFADALAALCSYEGHGQVDVLGHSLGGTIGLRLAVRRPALVRRLVLAAAAGLSSSGRGSEAFIRAVGLIQPGRLAALRTEQVAGSPRLRRLVFSRFTVSDARALSARSVRGFLAPTLDHSDALGAGLALVAEELRGDLGRVHCPTLLLWGARDRQVPLADGFELARLLGAPLRTIADCGHLLIGERPDACVAAIEDFCD